MWSRFLRISLTMIYGSIVRIFYNTTICWDTCPLCHIMSFFNTIVLCHDIFFQKTILILSFMNCFRLQQVHFLYCLLFPDSLKAIRYINLRVCLFIVDIYCIYGHIKSHVYMLIANKVVLETNLIWNNKLKLHSSCRESKVGRFSCLKSKWTPIFRLFIWEPGILKFDYTNINFIILQHFWKACFPRIWLVCRRNVWIASFSKVSSLSLNEWMNAHEQHFS